MRASVSDFFFHSKTLHFESEFEEKVFKVFSFFSFCISVVPCCARNKLIYIWGFVLGFIELIRVVRYDVSIRLKLWQYSHKIVTGIYLKLSAVGWDWSVFTYRCIQMHKVKIANTTIHTNEDRMWWNVCFSECIIESVKRWAHCTMIVFGFILLRSLFAIISNIMCVNRMIIISM